MYLICIKYNNRKCSLSAFLFGNYYYYAFNVMTITINTIYHEGAQNVLPEWQRILVHHCFWIYRSCSR